MFLSHKDDVTLLHNSLIICIDYLLDILFSFTLVGFCCLILTAQERWSEAGATKMKQAITRYISSFHFQFNSIVRSRESSIVCPVLF
jgi:hypothetical protein